MKMPEPEAEQIVDVASSVVQRIFKSENEHA